MPVKKKLMTGVYIITIFICFLLQSTVFKRLEFAGISPNLLTITTTSIGLMKGEKRGLTAGFFSGLLIDIFSGSVIGFYALIYMYLGYVVGKFSQIFYPEDIKLPLALITLNNLTYGMICYIFMFLLRGRFDFAYHFLHIILPETVYTIIISIFLYPYMLFIYKKLNVDENRSDIDFV